MALKERLLAALPFSQDELILLTGTAPFRYKEYTIPKRQPGRYRKIAQPTPELKLLQRWLIANELQELPVHPAATAYKVSVGLLDNVKPHAKNRFLLKIDFENFFPSMTSRNFQRFMVARGTPANDVAMMTNLFFKYDRASGILRLAIGAPSSPTLSNMLMYALDVQISKRCDALGIIYTRYADDLSFSTSVMGLLPAFERELYTIIADYPVLELKINPEKTVHASKKRGRRITGLVISAENSISIGRNRKRLLRSQIDHFQKGRLDADAIESLKGYLAFLNSVEPDQIVRLTSHYGKVLMARLL
ncbi:MAG: RNA-directed polymerase [Herbaspirillum sp.]|nr:RNA-directed polymerase [Herbaspirillum sp.]